MPNKSTQAKRKYNKSAYCRHEFSVRLDSKLQAYLERYASVPGNSVSKLIKELLGKYFNTSEDDIHVEYMLRNVNGVTVQAPTPPLSLPEPPKA